MFGWVIVGDIPGSVWTVLLVRRGVVDTGVWRARHDIRRIAHTVEFERSEDILLQDGASYIVESRKVAKLARLRLSGSIEKMSQSVSVSACLSERQTIERQQLAGSTWWSGCKPSSAVHVELEGNFLIGPDFDTPPSA